MVYDGEGKGEIIFDLRQIYAKIVGEHLAIVAIHRMDKDYPKWLEALQNLYVEVDQEFKEEEIKDYKEKLDEVIKVVNEKEDIFLGKSKKKEEIAEVEKVLCDLNISIKRSMKKRGMFGSQSEQDSLM